MDSTRHLTTRNNAFGKTLDLSEDSPVVLKEIYLNIQ